MTENNIINLFPDADSAISSAKETKTTCAYCGVGCGVVVEAQDDGSFKVRGDEQHPANFGRLCSKGSSLAETLSLEGRLLAPKISGREVEWDEALDTVASKFSEVLREHGPDSVAMYVSGQILTEDYYVANKLMKGFIGNANIDTNSRLCMSTAASGHKRAFGTDTVSGCYEDLEQADLLVITGSNLAWAHPIVYQRVLAAKEQRPEMKVVLVDPRKTATSEIADLHLSLKPGSDAALFNGLLDHLISADALDHEFIVSSTEGFSAVIAEREPQSIEETASQCDLSIDDLETFFSWFENTPRTVTLFSQGINQSSSGVDKVNSIINVHLATGRIGKEGASPFSITGQPNAMGGREVGGLANQLAAHMELEPKSIDRVGRFWNAPNMATKPGLSAVDLFKAVEDGRVKAIWIMSTNPVVSMPEADKVKAALEKCEFVVVSDCVEKTDTTACADVLLPAAAWGEKDGMVTNSERRISHQKAFLPLPGQARPDWWAITQVAQRMGYADAFPYERSADIFREHAALSGFENNGSRDFDISACADLSNDDYFTLNPFQWPLPKGSSEGKARLFEGGRFFTPSERARFVPVTARAPANQETEKYPLVFNTGRIRDQWHTMTRSGKTDRLMGHMPEPFVEINPDDGARYGLRDGGLAEVYNQNARLILRVKFSDSVRSGSIFSPIHWTQQFASAARVSSLVNSIVDPISHQPEFKHAPVAIKPWSPAWQGFVLTRNTPANLPSGYWAKVREKACQRYVMASQETPDNWAQTVRDWFGEDGRWLELVDSKNGGYRAAKIVDGQLETVVVFSGNDSALNHAWLTQQFEEAELAPETSRTLLSGRSAGPMKDTGPVVCACFSVGLNTIVEAIHEQGLLSVEQIGQALKAGTNCGGCKPELGAILQDFRNTKSA